MGRHAASQSIEIQRIHYGFIVSPAGQPDAGQPLPVSGFLVQHPAGTILFDTGISPFEEDVRERYHPRTRSPREAVQATGVDHASIDVIANCHLHSDHAGGNYEFAGVPILVQRAELDAAAQPDYTYPKYTFDFPGSRLQVIEGEHEVFPGVRLVPTPGHSPGHQSLLLETDTGVTMLAGQAANTTWEFSTSAFAERVATELGDDVGRYPSWISELSRWGVERALFAHDLLVWERDISDLGRPRPA
jgi:glyoxylase-like metal-dependent hydrolase (beta-lactamase superfamily II)